MSSKVLTVNGILPYETLEQLNTKRLKGVLKKINECHETQNWDNNCNLLNILKNDELTKDMKEWTDYKRAVKTILSTRENV